MTAVWIGWGILWSPFMFAMVSIAAMLGSFYMLYRVLRLERNR